MIVPQQGLTQTSSRQYGGALLLIRSRRPGEIYPALTPKVFSRELTCLYHSLSHPRGLTSSQWASLIPVD